MLENNKPITEKQRAYLTSLMKKDGVKDWNEERMDGMTRYHADVLIKECLGKNWHYK